MSDGQGNTAGKALSRAASPDMAKLDHDIRTRFARRTGDMSAFLQQWIRLDEAQHMFFNFRGIKGENYRCRKSCRLSEPHRHREQ
jgi:hypothetical protein